MKRKVQLEGELVQGPAAWEVLRAGGKASKHLMAGVRPVAKLSKDPEDWDGQG